MSAIDPKRTSYGLRGSTGVCRKEVFSVCIPLDSRGMHLNTGFFGAEGLAASPASVSTTLPELGLVEAVADDLSRSGFSGRRTFPVCATETLHCCWTGQP